MKHEESPEAKNWFGLLIKPKYERISSEGLRGKGYETYLPLYRSRKRWSDRNVISDTPLFPRYLFCSFNPSERRPVLTTPGVISILGVGASPKPISSWELEAVRAVLLSGMAVAPCPFVREGQQVRVNSGPLEGLEGILLQNKNEWSVVVSVNILQRSVKVEIDPERLTAL